MDRSSPTTAPLTDRRSTNRRSSGRRAITRAGWYSMLLMLLGALIVTGTYQLSYRHAWDELQQSGQRRLEFLSSDLASALDKYDTLPIILASHPDLVDLLSHPSDTYRRDAVNLRLARIAAEARVAAIFVMDPRGMTIAASNWKSPSSFVGQNYSFRPYFRDALQTGAGRFYAIGATTGEPGYFLAQPVLSEGAALDSALPIGVVAVKISLDDIESNWKRSGEYLMLADNHGVIFLSSRADWKFRTLEALSPQARQHIQASQQYGDHRLEPLAIQWSDGSYGRHAALSVSLPNEPGTLWRTVDGQQRALGRMDWTLLSFSEVGEIVGLAQGHAAAAGFAYAFVLVGALYTRLRRRRDQERRVARRELERANTELERRISERTAVLVEANRKLADKNAELDLTQATLRATQDDLIQAGKLTVLGQMAASITHEINQPLAALRVMNDNAIILLDRGDPVAARANLGVVDGLTQRIASIVAQLKGFARKDDLKQVPVAVGPVVDAAISLLAADVRRDGVPIHVGPIPVDLAVHGQEVRIEQVLVNLIRNALDAVRGRADAQVRIDVFHDDPWVRITVIDNAGGISPSALPRLFEPFFTTKPAGQGLGLGLAISASIANALGGTLEASNLPTGGAAFTLKLHAAVCPSDIAMNAPRNIG